MATKLARTLALVRFIVTDQYVERAAWAGVVLDAGYGASFAVPHVVSGYNVVPVGAGVVRVDVGGKTLTNVLKEAVSFRHWNMMQEVLLVQDIKEKACFVSQDFARDLKRSASCPPKYYLLPDYSTSSTGHILTTREMAAWLEAHTDPQQQQQQHEQKKQKEEEFDAARAVRKMKAAGEQILALGREQFTVPEVLFNPSDVGINQFGVVDALDEAVRRCTRARCAPDSAATTVALQDALYSRVLLRGGCSLFPGFCQRVETDLLQLAPNKCPLSVVLSDQFVACLSREWCLLRVCCVFMGLCVLTDRSATRGREARCWQ